jgi:hypothetical protein
MIQLSNAATYPEAVVVKLVDAPVAVSAVLGSVGQPFDSADVTPSILRALELSDIFAACQTLINFVFAQFCSACKRTVFFAFFFVLLSFV